MATRTRRSSAGRPRRSAEPVDMIDEDYGDEEYREPGEGYQGEQPTKGLYTCKLVEIRNHETDEGNKSRRWTFELVPGSENKHGDDVSGWRDYRYTNNDSTKWLEQQILVALGVIKPGGKVKLSFPNIVKKAKECTVRVDVERYIPEDGEPEWRGRMGAFLPLREAGPKSRRRARDDEEPEDEDEDDADDGDDDEEGAPPTRSRRSRPRKEPEPEPEDEDEEGDEEDYDPDELAAELADLSLAALKKRARDEFGVKIARGMDADAIIDAILETLDEDGDDEGDEDEPEDEPEPPKRRSRSGGGRAAASKTRSRRSRGSDDDPPF